MLGYVERAIANRGRSSGTVGDLFARRPVVSFFVVTFAWSWSYWAVVGALVDAESISYLVTMPGLWGPVVAAIAVTRASGGSVRWFLGRALRSSVATRWWVVAVGGPLLLGLVGPVARLGLTDAGVEFAVVGPLVTLVVAVFAGGSEEIGLRGFAHPRLRERYGGLWAGVLIGVPWAVWHLPLQQLGVGFDGSFPLFVVSVVGISVLLGWLYDGAGGSVLPAVLAHAGFDAPGLLSTVGAVPDDVAFASNLSVVAVYWILVVVLVAKNGVRLTSAGSLPSSDRAADQPTGDSSGR